MHRMLRGLVYALVGCSIYAGSVSAADNLLASNALRKLNLMTQPRVVKIFGVGGLRQLEAYQTGVLISAEGHILTTQSLVLDEGEVTVVLSNGARATGTVAAVDPVLELALLKIELETPVDFFPLEDAVSVAPGNRILAFANVFGIAVYDEPVSVLQGVVTGIAPLAARRGAFHANYSGDVYILDAATNNPGAAGGAVVDLSGRLIGLIGKELRSEASGIWLNYAIPVSTLVEPVERMLAGESAPRVNDRVPSEPSSLPKDFGIVLVPNLVERTPPFVERVVPGSAAEDAGIRSDDLIVAVGDRTVGSLSELSSQIAQLDSDRPLRLTLLRNRELVRISLEEPRDRTADDE